jgi:hypothetical protein
MYSSTPYSRTLLAHVPPSVWETKFPAEKTDKIVVLYVFIFKFLGGELEYKTLCTER